jgi:hypothetical protein
MQAGLHLGPLEIYGGGGVEISKLTKPLRLKFVDTPEVEELYYKMQKLVKPINVYWMGTVAFQISKHFELQAQYVESIGSITKNLVHEGEEFTVTTRFARASVAVLHRFDPKKIRDQFRKD